MPGYNQAVQCIWNTIKMKAYETAKANQGETMHIFL